MYKVWCEWDIGCEDIVWKTLEGAEKFAQKAIADMGEDYNEMYTDAYIGFTKLKVEE